MALFPMNIGSGGGTPETVTLYLQGQSGASLNVSADIPYKYVTCTFNSYTNAPKIRNATNTAWVSMTLNTPYAIADYINSNNQFVVHGDGGSDKAARFILSN